MIQISIIINSIIINKGNSYHNYSVMFINSNFYLINLILIKTDNLYDTNYC